MLDTTECYEENRKGEYTFLVLYCIYRKKKKSMVDSGRSNSLLFKDQLWV